MRKNENRLVPRVSGVMLALLLFTDLTSASGYAILFGGDTSHGENYQAKIHRNGGENILESRGYEYSFAGLQPIIELADIAVVNLETPLVNQKISPLQNKKLVHWSDPVRAAESLAKNRIQAVSLANNHAMDFGAPGLVDTLRALSDKGISGFGAGNDKRQAIRPWRHVVDIDGTEFSISVIGAFENMPAFAKMGFYADENSAGAFNLTRTGIAQSIRSTRQAHPDDLIIVFPHWGYNYQWQTQRQRGFARVMIDAGADLIMGHGSHMLQGIERYKGKWIIYSLGNFAFNSSGRFDKFNAPPFSLVGLLSLATEDKSKAIRLRLYPIYSNNLKTRFQPRSVNLVEMGRVTQLLEQQSVGWSTDSDMVKARADAAGYYFEMEVGKVSTP